MALTNGGRGGILAVGISQSDFSALPYTAEDLTQDKRGDKHPVDIARRDFVTLNLDYGQMGVGGDDFWAPRRTPSIGWKCGIIVTACS